MAMFPVNAERAYQSPSIPVTFVGRSRRIWLPALLTVLLGCEPSTNPWETTGQAMGTTYSVVVVAPDSSAAASLPDDIRETIMAIENRYSTYMPDSEVSRFNAEPHTDWSPVSGELCAAFEKAIALSRLTEGSFDITVAPLVDAWGFGPGEDVVAPLPQTSVDALMGRVGFDKLDVDCDRPAIRKRNPSTEVDFSAWAKGHAIDRLAERLNAQGIENYLVEIGGEIRAGGLNPSGKPWSIAIADPRSPGTPLPMRVSLTQAAMATSGDYANYFTADGNRYSHIIDPRTGSPTGHALTAVTVVADLAASADALATALLVLGPEKGYEFAARKGIAASFLVRDGEELQHRSTEPFAPYLESGQPN